MRAALKSVRYVPMFLAFVAPASAQTPDAVTTPTRIATKVRPRLGVSLSGGLLLASAPGANAPVLAGEAGAIDLRAGVQLSDLFALYVQPAAVIGSVNTACFGMTEAVLAFWVPVLVDFTIAHRVSIAVGGGLAAVPDQAPGWTVHFRVATYPWMRHMEITPIREGFSVALETRAYELSASGAPYVGGLFMLAVGYERF